MTSPRPVIALWRAGKFAAFGYVLLVASFLTVVIGSRTANRPHEVKGEGLFFLLIAVHAVVGGLVLHALVQVWRRRREGGVRAVHVLLVLFAGVYAAIVVSYYALLVRSLVF